MLKDLYQKFKNVITTHKEQIKTFTYFSFLGITISIGFFGIKKQLEYFTTSLRIQREILSAIRYNLMFKNSI